MGFALLALPLALAPLALRLALASALRLALAPLALRLALASALRLALARLALLLALARLALLLPLALPLALAPLALRLPLPVVLFAADWDGLAPRAFAFFPPPPRVEPRPLSVVALLCAFDSAICFASTSPSLAMVNSRVASSSDAGCGNAWPCSSASISSSQSSSLSSCSPCLQAALAALAAAACPLSWMSSMASPLPQGSSCFAAALLLLQVREGMSAQAPVMHILPHHLENCCLLVSQ